MGEVVKLRKTTSRFKQFTQPGVVIFLDDIMYFACNFYLNASLSPVFTKGFSKRLAVLASLEFWNYTVPLKRKLF